VAVAAQPCMRSSGPLTVGQTEEWHLGFHAVLDAVDILIDGPYIEALSDGAGPWTGSGNQRVIDLAATRQAGQVVLLEAAARA